MKSTRWAAALLAAFAVLGGFGRVAAQTVPTAGPVREFSVEDGRLLGLSPDGTRYAVAIQSTALCVYNAETLEEVSCGSLQALEAGLRYEDVVWSPDSTRLAFAEQSFRLGEDGDLWVMDARDGTITNVTDDGYSGPIVPVDGTKLDGISFFVDVAPAWTPDSQYITFSRSGWINGERTGNDLAQVVATGGEVKTLATVSDTEPGVVYLRAGWAPDGQTYYFSLTHVDPSDPENGIWTYDPTTGQLAQLATADTPDLGPLALLQVSPAGDRLLAWYPEAFARFSVQKELLRLVATATGALQPVALPVPGTPFPGNTIGTFSPDGRALLLLQRVVSSRYQLWVTDLATTTQTLLLDNLDNAADEPGLTPSWGANGNVALRHGAGTGYLTSISGIGTDIVATPAAVPTSPANQGTPAGGAVQFAPGSDVQTNGIAPIFAGPDAESPIVAFLPPNHVVHVLTEPIENDEGIWYPVFDPESQIIGYVQASRLEEIA